MHLILLSVRELKIKGNTKKRGLYIKGHAEPDIFDKTLYRFIRVRGSFIADGLYSCLEKNCLITSKKLEFDSKKQYI